MASRVLVGAATARAAGVGGRTRRRARRAGLRPGRSTIRDRGRLHPAAERPACRVDDRRPGGGQGRPLREAALRHARGDLARARGRAQPRAARCGRRSCSRSTTRWSAFATPLADGRRSARCARSRRASISCSTIPRTSACSAELAGGSLQDVGCYPIRLARLLFDAEPDPDRAIADAVWLPPASTPSCGARSRSPATGGWCCRAGSVSHERHVHPRARHRRRDPHDEPVPPRGRRHAHDRARRRGAHAAGRPRRRAFLHAGDPAHPRRAPRQGAASPPGGGRGDGQRHGDRNAPRRGEPHLRVSCASPARSSGRFALSRSRWHAQRGRWNPLRRGTERGGRRCRFDKTLLPEAVAGDGTARPAHPRLEEGRMRKALAIFGGMMLLASLGAPASASSPKGQRPEKLLCNEGSPICAEAVDAIGYEGEYTGHDEPSLLFYSDTPGSGNNQRLPARSADGAADAARRRTGPAERSTSRTGSRSGSGWTSATTSRRPSSPTRPARPTSDTNIFDGADPTQARLHRPPPGTAFLELQFYPPGWVPFENGDQLRRHQVVRGDGHLQLQPRHEHLRRNNADCLNRVGIEPPNFAFITKSGVPQAPPAPLNFTLDRSPPNPTQDLFMEAGDRLTCRSTTRPRGWSPRSAT